MQKIYIQICSNYRRRLLSTCRSRLQLNNSMKGLKGLIGLHRQNLNIKPYMSLFLTVMKHPGNNNTAAIVAPIVVIAILVLVFVIGFLLLR